MGKGFRLSGLGFGDTYQSLRLYGDIGPEANRTSP